MAAKTSWHRYGTKLRHCHRMYICFETFATRFPFRHPPPSAMRIVLLDIEGRVRNVSESVTHSTDMTLTYPRVRIEPLRACSHAVCPQYTRPSIARALPVSRIHKSIAAVSCLHQEVSYSRDYRVILVRQCAEIIITGKCDAAGVTYLTAG